MGGLVFKVERIHKKVKRVIIPAGVFDISFVERDGKVVKESVVRHDRSADLYVPDFLFIPAINQARAIFAGSKKRKN